MLEVYDQFKCSATVVKSLLVVSQALDAMIEQLNNLMATKYDEQMYELEQLLDQNDVLLHDASDQLRRSLMQKIELLDKL